MLRPEFIVEPCHSGIRIDSFLSRHLRNYTPWRIHRMVTSGLARIDDIPAAGTDRVFTQQRISIQLAEPPDKLLSPFPCSLTIVYEDPWIAVVDKQAGLVAHPVGEFQSETLSNALQSYFDQQTQHKGMLRPGIVHRLDRMTSGLIVTAKEHMAHRLLSIDFQQGRLSKKYLALIEGTPEFQTRTVELPIGQRRGGNSVLMSARPDAIGSRPAKTRIEVIHQYAGYSLVRCQLFTGRNHQIRVHAAEIGHPVVGDEYYGPFGTIRATSPPCPDEDGETPQEQRHALHAASLSFMHPILRTWMSFDSAPPVDFWNLAPDSSA